MLIEDIREKIATDQFEFSKHAVDQSILRQITVQEIREVIAMGQVIEKYPNDKYGPSCLICGYTANQRPLHIQYSYPSRPLLKLSLCMSLIQKNGALTLPKGNRQDYA